MKWLKSEEAQDFNMAPSPALVESDPTPATDPFFDPSTHTTFFPNTQSPTPIINAESEIPKGGIKLDRKRIDEAILEIKDLQSKYTDAGTIIIFRGLDKALKQIGWDYAKLLEEWK